MLEVLHDQAKALGAVLRGSDDEHHFEPAPLAEQSLRKRTEVLQLAQ